MQGVWFRESNVLHGFWVAEWWVGEPATSVMDDFGNLVPCLPYKSGFVHYLSN